MIGTKVWIFDQNRRIYKDDKGNKNTSPWYRGHFDERYIIGETSQSWILGFFIDTPIEQGYKIKKKEAKRHIYFTEQEINEHIWIKDNRYKMGEKVKMLNDYNKLKQIEKILTAE